MFNLTLDGPTVAAALVLIAAGGFAVYAIVALKAKVWSACGLTFGMSAMLVLLSFGMYMGVYTPIDQREPTAQGAVLSTLAAYTTAQRQPAPAITKIRTRVR